MKKMEMEMEQVFEMKVKEKVQKLKDSEAETMETFPSTGGKKEKVEEKINNPRNPLGIFMTTMKGEDSFEELLFDNGMLTFKGPLQRRHEQMKKNLEAQHKELEEKRRQFEDEKANWEAQQRILEQQNSSREA
ncbi:hypothetical protein P7K49_024895 [Saguinus oedipus]|uniref:Uncharacterized protein n=1 Tax=Saguinus oedipus TaxID=9490 RepID=A0ABQ9UFM9_SAGOE|nr:hypothetical protein P7K49_024895 [Saguinus oedipus]